MRLAAVQWKNHAAIIIAPGEHVGPRVPAALIGAPRIPMSNSNRRQRSLADRA